MQRVQQAHLIAKARSRGSQAAQERYRSQISSTYRQDSQGDKPQPVGAAPRSVFHDAVRLGRGVASPLPKRIRRKETALDRSGRLRAKTGIRTLETSSVWPPS